jgi:outer membrane protein assembly factor BamB
MMSPRPRSTWHLRALVAFGVAAGAMIFATGCKSARTGALPELPTWYKRPNWAMSIADRRQITAVSNTTGEDYERGQPELDPLHQRVFVGSSDRGLYALQADDLSTIWRFQTLGVVQSEPLYDRHEDVVYFGSHDGAFYKVRAADGELVWRFSSNAEVSRRALLANGLLYFVNANDTIVAVEPDTGKMRWTQHRSPAYGMEIAGYAGAASWANNIYTSFSDGRVYAFDAQEGKERWSVDLAAEAEAVVGDVPRYLDADATPVPARTDGGMVVFVASYAGGVHALDAETGSRAWANDRAKGVTDLVVWEQPSHTPRDGGPAIPPRRILLASSGTTGLWALDINDGHDLWRKPLPEGGVSAPIAVGGALLVSTTRYGLFLMSPLDGAVIDGLETGSGFAMTPVAHGRRAYAMTNQGVMLSLLLDLPKPSAR